MICNNIPENLLLPVPIEELPILIKEVIKTKPDDEWVYLDADMLFREGISIDSKCGAAFNHVFTNQFVYNFMASLRFSVYSDDIDRMNETDRREWQSTIKHINDTTALHRQQLYDIVHLNTKPGEVVEIYSEWVNDTYVYGPPTEVRVIDAEQILTSELLDFNERLKIEILHME